MKIKNLGGETLWEDGLAASSRSLAAAVAAGCDLRGADLSGANLSGANLRGANLRGANLRGANLRGANLRGANLRGANLRGADLSMADLSWSTLPGAVPVVTRLDARIAAAVGDGAGLNMEVWHTCATTHCRGGWAVHLAGAAGRDLEARLGANAAAALIYAASRPGRRIPDFFADAPTALADIRASAAMEI